MKDIVREYQEQFRRHRMQLRRYTALLLALAMVTTLFVNWQLHSRLSVRAGRAHPYGRLLPQGACLRL
mgnify:CR=1 FL=1